MKDLTDQALIQHCIQGDLTAFEHLVSRYEARVFAVAYRLTGNRQDGEDLAQETFVRAWKALPNFRGEASLSTWLITITTNLWRDQQRKHKLPVESMDDSVAFEDGEVRLQWADPSPGPQDIMEDDETRRQLGQWISNLKPEFKTALILRDIQGYSYEEVAVMTRTSIGTVKSRINRARGYLKDMILAGREQNLTQIRLSDPKEPMIAEGIWKGGENQ